MQNNEIELLFSLQSSISMLLLRRKERFGRDVDANGLKLSFFFFAALS